MKTNFLEVFKGSYVQLFDDRKYWKDKPLLPKYNPVFPIGDLVKNLRHVRELNSVGIGVFFTPNPCRGGRKEEDVAAIEWVFVDMDTGTKTDQMERIKNSPIAPSIIIESLRSYHCYWRCDVEATKFKDLIEGIIIHFNGDAALNSPNEVLRFPGFFHNKYKDNPFVVKMLKFNEEKVDYNQMIEAYPKPMDRWKRKYGMADDDLAVLKDIPIKQVLDKLGVQYSNKREIIENGEITSAIINEKQNYVNRFSGKPPSGSTIDLAMHYNNTDVKGAIAWLKDNFLAKEKPLRSQRNLVKKENYAKRYTWGTMGLNHTFAIIKRESLIVLYGSRGQGKTTYVFDMANKNAELGHRVLFYSLEMQREALISELCRKYAGITIKEEYEYVIPDQKQKASDHKKKELESAENLIFKGMRGDTDKSWERIIENILEYNDLDLVIIDNLDLIAGNARENNNDKQARIIKAMMAFTSEYKIPIILLHHQRKFSQNGKSSGMDDMSGSGKVPDTADYVVRVIRDTNPLQVAPERYKTVLHMEKARGYAEEMKDIFFYKGSFYDEYPLNSADSNWWQDNNI